jgi:hypothetical protein
LIATPCAAEKISRRAIFRSTWQNLYKNENITFRFVLGQIDPLFAPVIQIENETYGDIISLPWLQETHYIANSVKSVEFFRFLIESNLKYDFVSKMDDDSFLNVPAFWNEFLEPRLLSEDSYIFGRDCSQWSNFIYPGGQFYTLSWNIVEILVQAFAQNPQTDVPEDLLVGNLLHEAHANFTFVNLDNRQAFDWVQYDDDPNAWGHKVLEGAINPHGMKLDEEYLRVASLFDREGLNLTAVHALG